MSELKTKPVCYLTLNNTLSDYSGYGNNGSWSTVPTGRFIGAGLVAGYRNSYIVSPGKSINVPKIKELIDDTYSSFSISITFQCDISGKSIIFDPQGNSKGLYVDQGYLYFEVVRGGTENIKLSHYLGINKIYNVSIAYSINKLSLYLDGELVDSADTDSNLDFDSTGTYRIGNTSFTNSAAVLVNRLLIHDYALNGEQVIDLQNDFSSLATSYHFGGTKIGISEEYRFPKYTMEYTSETLLNSYLDNTFYDSDYITSATDNSGLTKLGYATFTTTLTPGESAETITTLSLDWDGEGILVETSIDSGSTWITENNYGISGRSYNAGTVSGKTLLTRVTFLSGNDPEYSYLSRLRIRMWTSNILTQPNEPTITFTNSISLPDNMGSSRNNPSAVFKSGSLLISSTTKYVYEMWLKKAGALTITTFNEVLINGQSYSNISTLNDGEWALCQFKINAGTPTFSISGTFDIIGLYSYPTLVSNSDLSTIYNIYTESNTITVDDSSTLTVSDDIPSLYSYVWSISASSN